MWSKTLAISAQCPLGVKAHLEAKIQNSSCIFSICAFKSSAAVYQGGKKAMLRVRGRGLYSINERPQAMLFTSLVGVRSVSAQAELNSKF